MSSTTKISLLNNFSLRGFDCQNNFFRTNDKMMFPVVKNGDNNQTHESTIYSLLLQQPLTKSVSTEEQLYTITYSKQINTVYTKIPAEDIVCAYVDISRSVVVSPETAYPFGSPTIYGEIVTCNVNFVQNYIIVSTKGDWSRYKALIVLNLIVKDTLANIYSFNSMPIQYNEFVK